MVNQVMADREALMNLTSIRRPKLLQYHTVSRINELSRAATTTELNMSRGCVGATEKGIITI